MGLTSVQILVEEKVSANVPQKRRVRDKRGNYNIIKLIEMTFYDLWKAFSKFKVTIPVFIKWDSGPVIFPLTVLRTLRDVTFLKKTKHPHTTVLCHASNSIVHNQNLYLLGCYYK